MKSMRSRIATAGLALIVSASMAVAQERSGEIALSGESVGVGVGFTTGTGALIFKGKTYPFSIQGLSVADVGIAKFEGAGDVYNLQRLEDFPGTYVAVAGGVAVSEGSSSAVLENAKGVRVRFESKTQGLKLNLSAEGVTVRLQ